MLVHKIARRDRFGSHWEIFPANELSAPALSIVHRSERQLGLTCGYLGSRSTAWRCFDVSICISRTNAHRSISVLFESPKHRICPSERFSPPCGMYVRGATSSKCYASQDSNVLKDCILSAFPQYRERGDTSTEEEMLEPFKLPSRNCVHAKLF